MTEKIIIAGAGGQGIMLLGKVLAQAAMDEGKFVTWMPAYGAEVRGGTAHCMLIISDQEIGSPRIETADSEIIMNEPSLKKFISKLKPGGLVLVNSSMVKDAPAGVRRAVRCPCTDMAVGLGNIKVANIIALGCFLKHKKIVALKSVMRTIEAMAPKGKPELAAINQQALGAGANYADD